MTRQKKRRIESDDSPAITAPGKPGGKSSFSSKLHFIYYDPAYTDDEPHRRQVQNAVTWNLQNAPLTTMGRKTVFGNHQGVSVMRENEDLREEMESMKAQLQELKKETERKLAEHETKHAGHETKHAGHETKLAEHDAANVDQYEHIHRINRQSADYREVRGRRLDVFRRDILRNLDEEGTRRIAYANETVHDGDAVSDAYLYTAGERADRDTFKELYEMDPEEVAVLEKEGKFDCIRVLNGWSTRVAPVGKASMPKELTEKFERFLKVLRKGIKADPMDKRSELGRAYKEFWDENVKHE